MATISGTLTKALAANSAAANFASLVPTATKPSGAGVFDLGSSAQPGGVACPDNVQVIVYGAGAGNGSVRVWGWRLLGSTWVPTLLAELLGTYAGGLHVAADTADLAATDLLADTLSLVGGATAGVSCEVVSPTGGVTAHAVIDLKGHSLIQFDPKKGTATNVNALWSPVDSKGA